MSVNSDDTDLLVFLPPDLYFVSDELHDNMPAKSFEAFSNVDTMNIRRYGSVDALTPPSRTSLRSRSHHGTPVKYATSSPHRNLLSTESYLSQKHRDEQNLRDIEEYLKKNANASKKTLSPVPKLNLPQVQDLLSQIDETERSMTDKYSDNEKNDECTASVRKALTFDSPIKSKYNKIETDQMKNELTVRTDDESLLTLHGLWSSHAQVTKVSIHEEMKVLKQRLEEERLRRQHCEDHIQGLQSRLLESEEKMAVAMQVDHEKNIAIKKLKESWSKSVGQWKEADSNTADLSYKLKLLEENFREEKNELLAKVQKYEVELLKSLDLVHDYKEQQISACKERDAAVTQLADLQSRMKVKENEFDDIEKELNDCKSQLKDKELQIDKLTASIRDLGENIKQFQEDKDRLTRELETKGLLHKKLDEVLEREGRLQEQLRAAAKTKADLKQYYQEQVESIVAEKQKHFQTQLENAEKKLFKQFECKEREIDVAASRERQELCESHSREVKIMEEAHHETVEFYKVEISLCTRKIDDLQALLARDKERKCELAHQVYNVFQNHWTETLKLIAPHQEPSQVALLKGSTGIKRQGTFTMGEVGERGGESSQAGQLHGSGTYRINETPQKIPPTLPPALRGNDVSSKDRQRSKTDKEKSPVKRMLF